MSESACVPLRMTDGVTPAAWLWSRVRRGGPTECWPCVVSINPLGYGRFKTRVLGEQSAHRLAWVVANGRPIPDGLFVCHHCDNPPCCNPAHLFLGTPADNTADMYAKGRDRHPTGDAHGKSKLTVAQKEAIRRDSRGSLLVAREYGISAAWVWKLRRGVGVWRRSPPKRGTDNSAARLTEDQVRAIRADKRTAKIIGAEYGVHFSTIHLIRQRRTWTHVA